MLLMPSSRCTDLPLVERWAPPLALGCVGRQLRQDMLVGVGLNRQVASRLAEDRLAEWRRLDYAQWRLMLDDSESRQVVAEDGKRYSVVSSAVDDGDGRIRMFVGVAHVHRVFHDPPPATSADARAALDDGDLPGALDTMVGSVLYGGGDWRELQQLYSLGRVHRTFHTAAHERLVCRALAGRRSRMPAVRASKSSTPSANSDPLSRGGVQSGIWLSCWLAQSVTVQTR